MKQFKEELINYIFDYEYVTRDGDGEIIMWKEKPFHSSGGNYWVGNGKTIRFDEKFIFSDFEDVKWRDCIISIGEEGELINLRCRRNDLLDKKYKIDDIISYNYFNDFEFIFPIIELEKVREQIEEAINKLDSEINNHIQNRL